VNTECMKLKQARCKKMEKAKYKPQKNGVVGAKDAQKVGEHLKKLTIKNGNELQPEIIVEDAKKPKSILHQYFEWDDSVASEHYRKWQARRLMASIVEVVVVKGTKKYERSFYSVKNKKGKPVYVTFEKVKKTPNYIVQLITEAQQHIERLNGTLSMLAVHLKGK